MLFIPGNNPSMLQNSGVFESDSIIIDLEDAVNVMEKDSARNLVRCYLDNLKEKCILETKVNLSKFLEENPLFSNIKYEEGRYYKVTQEKQQQLTSTLLMYQGYLQNGYEYPLTWNDTGSPCEPWTYKIS